MEQLLPVVATVPFDDLLGQAAIRRVTFRFGFAADSLRKKPRSGRCSVTKHSGAYLQTRHALETRHAPGCRHFPSHFSGPRPKRRVGDARNRSCELLGFSFPLTKTLGDVPHQRTTKKRRRTATGANGRR